MNRLFFSIFFTIFSFTILNAQSTTTNLFSEKTILKQLLYKINFGNLLDDKNNSNNFWKPNSFSVNNFPKILKTVNFINTDKNNQRPVINTSNSNLEKGEDVITTKQDIKIDYAFNFSLFNATISRNLEEAMCNSLQKKGIKFEDPSQCQNLIVAENKAIQAKNNSEKSSVDREYYKNAYEKLSSKEKNKKNEEIVSLYNPNENTTEDSCKYAFDKEQCERDLIFSCVRSYEEGSYMPASCKQVPVEYYSKTNFASAKPFTPDVFFNNNNIPAFTPMNFGISTIKNSIIKQNFSPQNLFGNISNIAKGNFRGKAIYMYGWGSRYACNNLEGTSIDRVLITAYNYQTAFGYKAMCSNRCKLDYRGVAVSQPYLERTYGSSTRGKDQLLKIRNVANGRCVIARIQDKIAVKSESHYDGGGGRTISTTNDCSTVQIGGEAVLDCSTVGGIKNATPIIDLSMPVMVALGGWGNIRVMFGPLKEGEDASKCVFLESNPINDCR